MCRLLRSAQYLHRYGLATCLYKKIIFEKKGQSFINFELKRGDEIRNHIHVKVLFSPLSVEPDKENKNLIKLNFFKFFFFG